MNQPFMERYYKFQKAYQFTSKILLIKDTSSCFLTKSLNKPFENLWIIFPFILQHLYNSAAFKARTKARSKCRDKRADVGEFF